MAEQQLKGRTSVETALNKDVTPQTVASEAKVFLNGMEELVRTRHKMEELERKMKEYVEQVRINKCIEKTCKLGVDFVYARNRF